MVATTAPAGKRDRCGAAAPAYNGTPVTVADLAAAKRLPLEFLRDEVCLQDLPDGVAIPYFDQTGHQTGVKRRTALKAKDGSRWPKATPLQAYGEHRIDRANAEGRLIIGEGESDGWACWFHGVPYLGLPGSSTARTLTPEHVACVQEVYVVREPDNGGETFVKGVTGRLRELGFAGDAFELRMPDGIKDPADLHVANPDQFEKRLEEAIQASPRLPLISGSCLIEPPAPEPWERIIPLGSTPAVQPFPLGVLPAHLVDFVDSVGTTLSCPADYVAVPMLALAAGAIGASRAIELKPGWMERAAFYLAVVGRPGSAKSPAQKTVASPVYAEQNRLKATWDRAIEEFELEMAAYDAARKAKKKEAGDQGELPARPRKPTLQRLYASDTTTEALAPVLLANPRGITIIRDELMAWVSAMNAYRAGKGADRQFFLSGWAGEPLCIDRKMQDGAPLIVPHPCFSIVGGLPPDMVGQFRHEQNLSDGFLDRLLFSFPDPGPVPGHNDFSIPQASADVWRNVLDFLWKLGMEKNDDGTSRPHVVRLTTDGKDSWKEFINAHAAEMNAESFPEHLVGPWSKLKGYCARLALVVHHMRLALDEACDEDVDGESVRRAVKLIDYFKSHARKVYATMDLDPNVAKAKKLSRWIIRERKESFTKREAHNGLQGAFKTADDLDAPLGLLLRHGHIRLPAPEGRSGPGRKPSPTYDVHPDLASTESTESTE